MKTFSISRRSRQSAEKKKAAKAKENQSPQYLDRSILLKQSTMWSTHRKRTHSRMKQVESLTLTEKVLKSLYDIQKNVDRLNKRFNRLSRKNQKLMKSISKMKPNNTPSESSASEACHCLCSSIVNRLKELLSTSASSLSKSELLQRVGDIVSGVIRSRPTSSHKMSKTESDAPSKLDSPLLKNNIRLLRNFESPNLLSFEKGNSGIIKLRKMKAKQRSVSLKNLSISNFQSQANMGIEGTDNIAEEWDSVRRGLNLADYQQEPSTVRKHLLDHKLLECEYPKQSGPTTQSLAWVTHLVHLERRKSAREAWARSEIGEIKETDEGLLERERSHENKSE